MNGGNRLASYKMNRSSLRNNWLEFKSSWNLPIILEVSIEYASIFIYYIYTWLFNSFINFELPLFRGQILQHLLQCNARVGGWTFPQDSFYFLCIFLLGNITIYCMIELLVIMPIYVFYNLDNLCTILFCFVRVCALLRVSAIKWYSTTNFWFWLLHTFEV